MTESATILIIEDNALNLKLVRALLLNGGYRVVEAMDAESGIRQAGAHMPELILMDIQLPGMDGLEATRIIKRDPLLAHIPVVALTSFAMEGDEEKALSAGCGGYITKPIDARHFLEVIRRYLPPRRSDRVCTQEPVIDPSILQNILAHDDGDMPWLLSELVETYLGEADRLLAALGQALAEPGMEQVQRLSHSLKSTSANIGAARLASACQELERKTRKDTRNGLGESYARIRMEYQIVRKALAEKVNGHRR